MILTLLLKIRNLKSIFVLATFLISAPAASIEKIALHALFKDKVIVVIDGARHVLKAGESTPEGVKLISVDTQTETAAVEIDGKRQELRLGMVGAGFASVGKASVTL